MDMNELRMVCVAAARAKNFLWNDFKQSVPENMKAAFSYAVSNCYIKERDGLVALTTKGKSLLYEAAFG